MEMAELVQMLRQRQEQEEISIEVYANKIGIRGSTLSRYYKLERTISVEVLRRLAQFYKSKNDSEMLDALASYALGSDNAPSSLPS